MNQRLLPRISLMLTATLIILVGSRGGESIHLLGKVSGGSGKVAVQVDRDTTDVTIELKR